MNGKVEAPSTVSGASTISTRRTTFPVDATKTSVQSLCYHLSRQLVWGVSLLRLLSIILVVSALLWGVGHWGKAWWVSAILLLIWLGCLGYTRYWKRRRFVRFFVLPRPTVAAKSLTPDDKIPVFVTGHLSVENKEQDFTWVPGFFRVFATREHALMCQVAQRSRYGIGQWPGDEIGLWYLFFYPHELVRVDWGQLYFGREPSLAVALTYRRTIPKRGRFRPEKQVDEIVYLAVATAADGERILADLQADQQSDSQTTDHIHSSSS